MLSTLKIVYFCIHVNGTTLNFFSSHLESTEQRLRIYSLKLKLNDNT
jgi:hypothetical protein